MLRLPKKLRVGPATIHVVYEKRLKDQGKDGFFSPRDQVIFVRPDMGPDETTDTLLHEVLHACIYQSGYLPLVLEDDDEERIVRTLTPILLDTLRRNKPLVRALLGE